jgi:hypothetical protein
MRVLSWVEFTQPDIRVPLFSPHGLLTGARLYDEASAEFVQRMVSDIELANSAPEPVREYFDYARKVFVRGFFAYELFTVSWFVAVLAQEFALGERFIAHFDGRLTFRHRRDGRMEAHTYSTFGALARTYRGGGALPPRDWTVAEAPGFRPNLAWLAQWAYVEGILGTWLDAKWARVRNGVRMAAMTGGGIDSLPEGWMTWDQPSREEWFDANARGAWERAEIHLLSEIRNLVAHPAEPLLISPVDAVQGVEACGEFISAIWSSSLTA